MKATATELVDENLPKVQEAVSTLMTDASKIVGSNLAKGASIANTLKDAGSLIGLGLTFSSAVFGLVKLHAALQGQAAENALVKLGVEIAASLKTSADCMVQQTSLMTQEKFGILIHDYVSYSCQADRTSWIFVYHPGTDWHPAFFKKNAAQPLPQLASVFHDMETMLVFLTVLRKVAGPNVVFRVLIPSTQILAIPSEVVIDSKLLPLSIECQKNSAGDPYVHVNFPGVPSAVFKHVVNEWREPKNESWARWTAANAGAWGTAVPVATAGSAVAIGAVAVAETTVLGSAAVAVAVGGAGGAAVIALPIVVVVGLPVLLAGAGVAAWAAAMASKDSVRNGHKKDDEKKAMETEKAFRRGL